MLTGLLMALALTLVPGADVPGRGGATGAVKSGLPAQGVAAASVPAPGERTSRVMAASSLEPACSTTVPGAPEYYAINLVATRQVVGTGRTRGTAELTFDTTPFGVTLAPDGSYQTTLRVRVDQLPVRRQGEFVAWATTPALDDVVRIGALDEEGNAKGSVEWNKFIVVVTLEAESTEAQESWAGPIVLRGMSRSGMMHTMAGHGPFEQQECVAFGY